MSEYLLHWLMSCVAILLTSYFVPGFKISGMPAALVASIVIGAANAIIWPILLVLTLPFTVLTFGLFIFVVNGLTLKIAAAMTPGFEIVGFWPAVWGAIVLTLTGWVIRFVIFGGYVYP